MASGSASYAVSATNYGRNAADSYFVLSAPDVINGSLEVTGNLRVDGTSRLVGAVTCDGAVTAAGAVTAGSVATAGNVTCAAVTASGAVNSATLSVSAASVLAGVTAQAIGCTSLTASAAVQAAGITSTGGLTAGASTLGVITSPGISNNSFGAANPTGFNLDGQWTIVLAGMRLVFQRVVTNTGVNPGLFAITTPLSYWSGGSAVAGAVIGQATAVNSLVGGAAFSARFINGGRVDGSSLILDGFLGDGAGTAQQGVSVSVMMIGPAA
jgi:cytoskeletal protein CcmA (bactofilin family)